MLISILLIEPFRKIWDVMIFSVAGKNNMNEYYSRLLTYFLLFRVYAGFTYFVPGRRPHKNSCPAGILAGLQNSALISVAYLLLGVNIIWSVGYLLKRKTKYIPIMTIIAAALNVILNYFLVPPFGMMGAAVATLISYFVWAVLRTLSPGVITTYLMNGRDLRFYQ